VTPSQPGAPLLAFTRSQACHRFRFVQTLSLQRRGLLAAKCFFFRLDGA